MIDIDGLMELFGEMQKAGIENLRIAMDDKNGMKFNLVITPPARCVAVQPEPVKAPEAVKEPEQEKAAQDAFRNAALEMKAFCADRWDHVPRDTDGDFVYCACNKCYYDPFCTKFGLWNGESQGPCDWKIT